MIHEINALIHEKALWGRLGVHRLVGVGEKSGNIGTSQPLMQ